MKNELNNFFKPLYGIVRAPGSPELHTCAVKAKRNPSDKDPLLPAKEGTSWYLKYSK